MSREKETGGIGLRGRLRRLEQEADRETVLTVCHECGEEKRIREGIFLDMVTLDWQLHQAGANEDELLPNEAADVRWIRNHPCDPLSLRPKQTGESVFGAVWERGCGPTEKEEPMKDKLRRLEKAAHGHLASFKLLDGSRYYFDPTSGELFLHWCACLRADSAHHWPEPPETYKKLTEAKYPERALEEVRGRDSFGTFPYEPEVLINERRLEPRGLVTRYDPETGEHYVRDPWEHQPAEDLSE